MSESSQSSGEHAALADSPDQLVRTLRLPSVLMQSIGGMAPVASVAFTAQFLASYAGIAVPGTILVALVIMLALAYTLAQIAKLLPSAGGYYTFVRSAFGARAGMAIGAAVLIYSLAPSMNSGYLSTALQSEIQASYNVNIPWQAYFVVIILSTGYFAYRGISISGKALLVLGIFEIAVLLALGLFGLISPGAGGVTLQSLNPLEAHGGLYLAVAFGMFFFAGWESAAPIAEESANPTRTVPRALVGSVLGIGIAFVIAVWGMISGWGVDNINGFVSSPNLAPLTLAHHYWHGAWWLMLLALVNSVIAISLAATLLVTRMVYAMSRVGVFPPIFSVLHPKYKTPKWATIGAVAFSLVVGLAAGQTVGPVNSFYIYGLAFTLLIIVVYIAGNLAVTKYYRKHHPEKFRFVSHALIPVVTSLALLYVGYASIWPFPAYPVAWGVWLAIAWILVLVSMMIFTSKGAEDEMEAIFLGDDLTPEMTAEFD